MNVFLLIEETDQKNYSSKAGFPAEPKSTVIGVYETREKAISDKQLFTERLRKNEKELNYDSCSYVIEERPLL